ncbi:hypothetical protein JTB14_030396 [Gonioctena quinquepunctata]|nr:hypothetical protein JTB14_030396 [Gonioctena quinquepunctata]
MSLDSDILGMDRLMWANQHLLSCLERLRGNTADQATKELNRIDFGVHSNWLKGPKFLKLPEETWPRKPEEYSEENIELPKIDRFSKWIRPIRSTARVLHFKKVSRIPKNNRPRKVKLDVDTLEEASKLWLKKSQGESFEEISLLNRNKWSLS